MARCKNCGEVLLENETVIQKESYDICTKCGQITNALICVATQASYTNSSTIAHDLEKTQFTYERKYHFRDLLAQFQGKETTQIPIEVIENIKLQIKKERIDLSQISNNKTKEILKKLGYNKYYEHIPFIKDKLGIKPPIMSPELEDTLCNLFVELQSPYSKYCPDDRVNFLNYYYTAYKLCELLGEAQYLEHFPMLKDREKRIEQDSIWRKICEELDWEFIPTI